MVRPFLALAGVKISLQRRRHWFDLGHNHNGYGGGERRAGARRYDQWDRGYDENLSDGLWDRYGRHRHLGSERLSDRLEHDNYGVIGHWAFTGGPSVLCLDSATMRWIDPGLEFMLTTDSGTSPTR
jgi:hypothetical protein